MLKKLTEDQQALIIEKATCEFAEKGFKGAGLSTIAKNAGVSVGVIYAFFEALDGFFVTNVFFINFIHKITSLSIIVMT